MKHTDPDDYSEYDVEQDDLEDIAPNDLEADEGLGDDPDELGLEGWSERTSANRLGYHSPADLTRGGTDDEDGQDIDGPGERGGEPPIKHPIDYEYDSPYLLFSLPATASPRRAARALNYFLTRCELRVQRAGRSRFPSKLSNRQFQWFFRVVTSSGAPPDMGVVREALGESSADIAARGGPTAEARSLHLALSAEQERRRQAEIAYRQAEENRSRAEAALQKEKEHSELLKDQISNLIAALDSKGADAVAFKGTVEGVLSLYDSEVHAMREKVESAQPQQVDLSAELSAEASYPTPPTQEDERRAARQDTTEGVTAPSLGDQATIQTVKELLPQILHGVQLLDGIDVLFQELAWERWLVVLLRLRNGEQIVGPPVLKVETVKSAKEWMEVRINGCRRGRLYYRKHDDGIDVYVSTKSEQNRDFKRLRLSKHRN